MSRTLFLVVAVTVLAIGWANDSHAVRHQPREGWVAGVSWGIGRGVITTPDGEALDYREGAAPQWRIGPMLGSRFLLALEHRFWFVERADIEEPTPIGEVEEGDEIEATKGRLTLQSFGLSLDFFPGNAENATGGIWLRVGAGIGWSGVSIFEGVGLGHGPRTDEAGFSALLGAGYDFWVYKSFMLGAGVSFNYLDIGGTEFVKKGWFAPLTLNGSLYF
jgi:hypothetical protein